MAEHQVMSFGDEVITATRATSCRNPHRPVRAQLTHTVPQAKPLLPLLQSNGGLVTRLVSAKSLSCVCPLDALPDVAFPPVGRLGLTSPPSTVLCDATTATCPSRGPSLVARSPIPCVLPRSWCPRRARVSGRSAQTTPGLLVTRSPSPGMSSRRQMALPRSRVPPVKTCPALRPRWCPAHSP